jgi:adenylate kinase family enzyme
MDEIARFHRVVVVGTSCAGKTTFARHLATALNAPHVELDSLYWGPNWTPVPLEQSRAATDAATAGPRWVCDGNYAMVRDITWRRATALVWLNFSFPVVFTRALRRTIGGA